MILQALLRLILEIAMPVEDMGLVTGKVAEFTIALETQEMVGMVEKAIQVIKQGVEATRQMV
jgi:hypothetical protein